MAATGLPFLVAQLLATGRIRSAGTTEVGLARLVEATGVVVHELTPTIAALGTQLPHDFPGDPADRMIAATARAYGLTLVTADERVRACPLVKTVW